MENKDKDRSREFQYTYSAREQTELRRIREKYAPPTEPEDKMERLRRLDSGVTRRAQAVALTLGIIGALALGTGMSLCMTTFGGELGLSESTAMTVGIAVGVVGAVLAGVAYPIYNAIVRRERRRVAPEILRLTDELMK